MFGNYKWGYSKVHFFLIVLLTIVLMGCKETSEDFAFVDDGSGEGSNEVGNSALTFTPSSFDFGPVEAYTGSSNISIQAENSADDTIYIASYENLGTHFAITANSCPTDGLASGESCNFTVRFSPQAPGLLQTTLSIKYSTTPGVSEFESVMGLSGTGVSPIVFAGIQSIAPKTHNTMTLNWTANNEAVSFTIFQKVGANLNFVKSVPNTGGTVDSNQVTGLTPNTPYTWVVRAIDLLGNQDTNTAELTDTTAVNQSPVLAAITTPPIFSGVLVTTVDARDTNTNTDFDVDNDAISYTCKYDNTINGVVGAGLGDCTAILNEGGGNPSFVANTGQLSGWIPRHAEIGTDYEFEIIGSDQYGAQSSIIFSGTVAQGTPDRPVVNTINVVSPINLTAPNTVTVSGTAQMNANLTVTLYSDATCATSISTAQAVPANGSWSANGDVTADATTTIYAAVRNIVGNESSCSLSSVSVTEDSTPPSFALVGGNPTDPESPSNDTTPTLNGLTEALTDYKIYDDVACTAPESASGTSDGVGNVAQSVTVNSAIGTDTVTSLYVVATDAAGNDSACTYLLDYTSYEIGTNLAFLQGTQNEGGGAITTNHYQGTPQSMLWNTFRFDSASYAYDGANPTRLIIKQAGTYLFSVNARTFSVQDRAQVRFQIYKNGVAEISGVTQNTYVRNANNNDTSSTHLAVALSGLAVDDYIEIKTVGVTSLDPPPVTMSGTVTVTAEFVPAGNPVFTGAATAVVSGVNVNPAAASPLSWTQDVNTGAEFTVTGASNQAVQVATGGDYIAHVHVPIFNSTSTDRQSPRLFIDVNDSGVPILGGEAMQSYTRASSENHVNGDLQWSGVITGLNPGDEIRFKMIQEAQGGTALITPYEASVYIERITTTNNMFFNHTQTLQGGATNWNPSTATNIRFDNSGGVTFSDATVYNHDPTNNTTNHQIQFQAGQEGDFLLIYNDSFDVPGGSSSRRVNPMIQVKKNGVDVNGATIASHYVRRTSNHYESSGSMVFLLRGLVDSDVITLTTQAETQYSDTVNIRQDAQIILIKKP